MYVPLIDPPLRVPSKAIVWAPLTAPKLIRVPLTLPEMVPSATQSLSATRIVPVSVEAACANVSVNVPFSGNAWLAQLPDQLPVIWEALAALVLGEVCAAAVLDALDGVDALVGGVDDVDDDVDVDVDVDDAPFLLDEDEHAADIKHTASMAVLVRTAICMCGLPPWPTRQRQFAPTLLRHCSPHHDVSSNGHHSGVDSAFRDEQSCRSGPDGENRERSDGWVDEGCAGRDDEGPRQ